MAEKLKIIPLGGLGEIGKNMTLIECNGEILVIDCGLMFPDEEMLGVDLVIPDITYLKKHKNKVRGIILTHGHEDHIGALPYVLREINARDEQDMHRAIAPLREAEDAVRLDTSNLDFEGSRKALLALIRERLQ